jgi:hypothetical protein
MACVEEATVRAFQGGKGKLAMCKPVRTIAMIVACARQTGIASATNIIKALTARSMWILPCSFWMITISKAVIFLARETAPGVVSANKASASAKKVPSTAPTALYTTAQTIARNEVFVTLEQVSATVSRAGRALPAAVCGATLQTAPGEACACLMALAFMPIVTAASPIRALRVPMCCALRIALTMVAASTMLASVKRAGKERLARSPSALATALITASVRCTIRYLEDEISQLIKRKVWKVVNVRRAGWGRIAAKEHVLYPAALAMVSAKV